MFHLEQCFIVEVSIFGIFWKIHLPTICIEYFWCAKQYVLLVWDSSLLLSIWAVSGSFQKLKAGLLESFKETQCLFTLKMWVTLNSIFSACFFHSSEHLWLGPYHPMVFLPICFPSLSSMANDHWGQLSLKKKTLQWHARTWENRSLTVVLLCLVPTCFTSLIVLFLRVSPVAQWVFTTRQNLKSLYCVWGSAFTRAISYALSGVFQNISKLCSEDTPPQPYWLDSNFMVCNL